VGGDFWWLGRPSEPAPALAAKVAPVALEALPPEVRAKIREADQGDVQAMHHLAIWYYYGINVPKDRDRGLEWYRKAVAGGSDAARQELAQIEGR
jgi:TPR repeat protein